MDPESTKHRLKGRNRFWQGRGRYQGHQRQGDDERTKHMQTVAELHGKKDENQHP